MRSATTRFGQRPGAAATRRPARTSRRPMAVALATVVILLVAGACSDDGDDVATGTSDPAATASGPAGSEGTEPTEGLGGPGTTDDAVTSATTDDETTSTSAHEGGIDTMDDASTEDRSGEATASGTALIEKVDVGRHEGYDRVTFQFRGDGVPGWDVGYLEPPVRQDGSGNVVEVPGDAVLGVRLFPASTVDLSGPELVEVYTGPDRIEGTGGVLREVVAVSDFEAQSRWALGLSDRVDFRVLTLEDPPRIAVDVRNH